MKNIIVNPVLKAKTNILKKSFLLFISCLTASVAWGQTQSFTADEIVSGATKGSVTVSTTFNVANKQMCKEGGSATKLNAVEGNSTASTVNEKYVQLTSTSDITKLVLHATYNSSGTGKNMAFVYWGEGVTPAIDNILSAELVSFTGYAGACDQNYSEVTLPPGVRTIRIYRQLKKFDGKGASSSNYGDGTTFLIADIDVIAGPAGPVAVTGVTLDKTSLSIEAGQTAQLTATVQPANADNQAVTWSSSDNNIVSVDATGKITANAKGSATITVTTADGGKTATCTVTVTEPAAPIEVTAIALKASTTIAIGGTETLTVTYTPADANTGKALTWKSDNTAVATVDTNGVVKGIAAGTANITATSTTNPAITATCAVTVQAVAVTGVSLNKTSINLQVGGSETLTATVTPANATNKEIIWNTSDGSIATINNGKVTAVSAGQTTITATTVDGNKTATCTVTVTAGPPVPSTGLTTHYPEVYEAKELAGGYGAELSVLNGREYEVFYAGRYDNGGTKLTIHVNPIDKSHGITKNEASTSYEAIDGWFKGTGNDKGTGFSIKDEFTKSTERCHNMKSSNYVEMHIQGYDQFSLYGIDKKINLSKPADHKVFKVLIDNVEQTMEPSTSATIRRFDITTGEHVIKIQCGDDCLFGGFSLRIAEEPRTKWLKGNDSTQVVMQTTAPKPVYYFTKYNSKGETKLIWDGPEATGITLTTHASSAIGDTLVLGGTANCPTGTYNYHVAAFYNGVETSRANGKFIVASEIKALTDTMVDAYQNEEMDQIQFRYYALSDADVTLTWTGATPAGITGSGSNGKYIIGGTPTTVGTYDFIISVTGGNSIKGKIVVRALDLGNDPVLYLYKNNLAYEQDGIYEYLTSAAGGKKNIIPRKAREDGLRPADQYAKYKWIIISEDVDANNAEVLAVAEGGANLPVLNLKSFTYAPGRLDWGEPDNGSITDNARSITVLRADHPIFASMAGISQGQKIDILSAINKKGLMPAAVDYEGTLCLATAWTRDINNYTGDGVQETFLHEVPAEMRGGKKYICLPIALQSSKNLSANGKKLISSVINYLLSSKATIDLPELKITSFKINGVAGTIDQANNTIKISFDITQYPNLDLTNIVPEVTLASKLTHFVPNEGEAVDFSKSTFAPVIYEVTDYINRRAYEVTVATYNPEGIENIYSVGEWVNIYDIYGRKVTTTNEDIYQMALPRGVYIIVLENGDTFKIMR